MLPLMYLLQGNVRELPQRTHRWNNLKVSLATLSFLEAKLMASCEADAVALPRWLGFLPVFHLPIVGGWKQFVVIRPVSKQSVWFVGWVAGDTAGISQIPLRSSVRLLKGPGPAQFFGLDGQGSQIALQVCGDGVIGKAGSYRHIPLL